MTQQGVARLCGSAITAWLLGREAAHFVSTDRGLPHAGLLLLVGVPLIGILFALPRVRGRAYLANALVAALVAAILVGLSFRSVDEDVTDRIAFSEGITMAAVAIAPGVILGGLGLVGARLLSRSRPTPSGD